MVIIPHVQVRQQELLFFGLPEFPPRHFSNNLPKLNTYTGTVTNGASKRIKKSVDLLLQTSPKQRIYNTVINKWHDFTIGFMTLTIAMEKNITARECYDTCLQPFIRTMKRKHNMKTYIWKAELQTRGQIHYHLTINQFIHHDYIQKEWNRLQKKAGYLNEFASKHKHFNPPSIHIKAVWKVDNLEAYLCKYLSKNTQNQTATTGKIWDCSDNLKQKRYSEIETLDLHWNCENAVKQGLAEKIKLEHCTIIKAKDPIKLMPAKMFSRYDTYIQLLRR